MRKVLRSRINLLSFALLLMGEGMNLTLSFSPNIVTLLQAQILTWIGIVFTLSGLILFFYALVKGHGQKGLESMMEALMRNQETTQKAIENLSDSSQSKTATYTKTTTAGASIVADVISPFFSRIKGLGYTIVRFTVGSNAIEATFMALITESSPKETVLTLVIDSQIVDSLIIPAGNTGFFEGQKVGKANIDRSKRAANMRIEIQTGGIVTSRVHASVPLTH